MTFREKNAWIAVLSTVVIWGYYFVTLVGAVNARTLDGTAVFWLFVWCMGITFVMLMGLNVVASIVARQKMDAVPDERERLVDARSNRIGLVLLELSGLAIVACNALIAGFVRSEFPADPAGTSALIMANCLLLALVGSATVREAIVIVQFRLMDA